MWEAEEQQAASSSGREDTGDAAQQQPSPEELLERLSRVMGGQFSPMRQWGSGRLDPFGSSSSEAWHRRVEEQTREPGAWQLLYITSGSASLLLGFYTYWQWCVV
jgi:hypothetical protein